MGVATRWIAALEWLKPSSWACSSAGRAPALQDAGQITQVPHLVSLTRKTHGATNLLNWTVSGPKANVNSNYWPSGDFCSTMFFSL